MTKREKEARRVGALESLRKMLKAGDVIYTVCTHVASSGMSRDLRLFIVRDNVPNDIGADVSDALDLRWKGNGSVSVSGCGLDVGHYIVHCLSVALLRGDAIKDGGQLVQRWL